MSNNTAPIQSDAILDRKLSITAGPFKGTQIPPEELRLFEETSDFGTKSYRAKWPHQARLARAMDVFKIEDGYGVIASIEPDSAAITISTKRYVNGVQTWTGPHPTQRHVAELQRNGQTLARATSLAPLDVERAHESGENNAISRLLDHLGLPAYLSLTAAEYALLTQQQVPVDGQEQESAPPPPATPAKPGPRAGKGKVVPIAAPKPTTDPKANTATPDPAPAQDAQTQDEPLQGEPEVESPQDAAQAGSDAVTEAGEAPVNRNTRVRALNLWRRFRRGQPFPEPQTEAEALELIATLENGS